MIQQPGGTNLVDEETTGEFIEAFDLIFARLSQYHDVLGSPPHNLSTLPDDVLSDIGKKEKLSWHKEYITAITAESVELLEAVPWKRWRPLGYKEVDRVNIAEEIIDIIFFLAAIRKLWDIPAKQLAEIFERKLIENHRRISIGYNKPADEM